MTETFEQFRQRMHCAQSTYEEMERWYWDVTQELAKLRIEDERLRGLLHQLLDGLVSTHPYARRPIADDWECAYCELGWANGSPEHHAEDCPVVLTRVELEEKAT